MSGLISLFSGNRNLKKGKNARKISPTLVTVDNLEDELMKEEIFGPIFPIIKIKSLEDALRIIKKSPNIYECKKAFFVLKKVDCTKGALIKRPLLYLTRCSRIRALHNI